MSDTSTQLDDESRPRDALDHRALAVLSPILIALTFCVGYALVIGFPNYPVADASDRIAYSAIGAAAIAVSASLITPRAFRFVLNLVAATVCVLPTLLPMVRPGDWTYGALAGWTAAVCVPAALLMTRQHCLRDRGEVLLVNLVTLGMTLAGAALLLSTGSLKLGQAGFALSAGVAIAVIVGTFISSIARSWGTSTMALSVLAGLLTSGYVWSELPLYAGLCVWAAIPIAWITRVPILARRPTWQRVTIVLLLAATPAAVAVTREAVKANSASQAADDDGY